MIHYKNNDTLEYKLNQWFLFKGIPFKVKVSGPYKLVAASRSKLMLFEKIIFENPVVKINNLR